MNKTATKKVTRDRTPKPTDVMAVCGSCPLPIYRKNEAGNLIHFKDGKPICAKCRVLQGSMGSLIKSKAADFEEDKKKREVFMQERADKEAREFGFITQKETNTGIIKQ